MTTEVRGSRRPSLQHPSVPKPGDVLLIDETASVQFRGDRRLLFRVIRIDDRPTYSGWAWLHGYSLDAHQQAIERRAIFVQLAGLKAVAPTRTHVVRQRANARQP